MLNRLIIEATDCDFKIALEKENPKSWLKSVSAFANGIGGTLFFGVANENSVVGLDDAQSDAEFISANIKARISPVPEFILTPYIEKNDTVLVLEVKSGRNTPYYYVHHGTKTAYVRFGNESNPAPDYILTELILKGTNQTYDAIATHFLKADYSFTLLEATYRERTGIRWEERNYESFGLVTDNGYLTRAGSLQTDQYIVYNSRIFCTRWNGLNKGSIFDDALDDREYEGSLIHLLKNGCDFIKIHSTKGFKKVSMGRIDKYDYAERAVEEALVNALIHRDYITQGTEVHIDIYDDRLEISSPGGVYKGSAIQNQDINNVKSERRNPILADLFNRMRYMERRGSGLQKIVSETEKLYGYRDELKPVFYSDTQFTVKLYNVNYNANEQASGGINGGLSDGLNGGKSVQVLNIIKDNPKVTINDINKLSGISVRTIERIISNLKNDEIIKRVGSKKTGYWEVKK